jgi:hypothetical protein
VVDWSYDLLFEDERRLIARLAAFTGGCDLAAAEAICADDQVPAGEILDVLSRLVDKSLVTGPAPVVKPGSASSRRCGSTAGTASGNLAKLTRCAPGTAPITAR